ERIAADPAGATLRAIMKHCTLAIVKSPLMKAVIERDMETMGKLSRNQKNDVAQMEKMLGFKIYLDLLGEHHLLRTDLSMRDQMYILSAVFFGFFFIGPYMPDGFTLSDEEMADL